MKVRADQIKHALSKRHTDDFFAAEVKTGPTHINSELLIFDSLAVKKSWANPCVMGYEIKVSRSDFLGDQKWPGYLAYCNMFSFVCPKDMISLNEIPPTVGLIYYYPETGALRTVRKAKHRLVEIPPELYMYIIFSKIESDRHPFFSSNREYFEAYLESRADTRVLGYKVARKLRDELDELREYKRRKEQESMFGDSKAELYNKIMSFLRKHNIHPNTYNDDWLETLEKAIQGGMSPQISKSVDALLVQANKLRELTQTNEEVVVADG